MASMWPQVAGPRLYRSRGEGRGKQGRRHEVRVYMDLQSTHYLGRHAMSCIFWGVKAIMFGTLQVQVCRARASLMTFHCCLVSVVTSF